MRWGNFPALSYPLNKLKVQGGQAESKAVFLIPTVTFWRCFPWTSDYKQNANQQNVLGAIREPPIRVCSQDQVTHLHVLQTKQCNQSALFMRLYELASKQWKWYWLVWSACSNRYQYGFRSDYPAIRWLWLLCGDDGWIFKVLQFVSLLHFPSSDSIWSTPIWNRAYCMYLLLSLDVDHYAPLSSWIYCRFQRLWVSCWLNLKWLVVSWLYINSCSHSRLNYLCSPICFDVLLLVTNVTLLYMSMTVKQLPVVFWGFFSNEARSEVPNVCLHTLGIYGLSLNVCVCE